MQFIGEIAALATAACFAVTSTCFTLSGRVFGSPLINRMRLLLGLAIMVAIHWLAMGEPLPMNADIYYWWWLGLSGVIGFTLGDASLFQAFVMVGPRLSMLMMALAPVLSVVLAWVFLGEILAAQQIIGILVTVSGIAWVVSDRNNHNNKRGEKSDSRAYLIGILFGLGGAVGQAAGFVLSKHGLANDFSPLSGNVIRLLAATLSIWIFTVLRGQTASSFQTVWANQRALGIMTVGTVMGPVLGVWLSLEAVQRAPVGVASTLMALTPIFLIPVGRILFGERITRRAIVGTLVAFAGTAMLFL